MPLPKLSLRKIVLSSKELFIFAIPIVLGQLGQMLIGAGDVLLDQNIARVSIVGVGMKSNPGVAAKMFEILAKIKVNIKGGALVFSH